MQCCLARDTGTQGQAERDSHSENDNHRGRAWELHHHPRRLTRVEVVKSFLLVQSTAVDNDQDQSEGNDEHCYGNHHGHHGYHPHREGVVHSSWGMGERGRERRIEGGGKESEREGGGRVVWRKGGREDRVGEVR